MKKNAFTCLMIISSLVIITSCNHQQKPAQQQPAAVKAPVIYRGLYSFGPEVKSFKACTTGQEYWVTDSSDRLELTYSQMNFEKPYTPVYVEVEGDKVRSGKAGMSVEFDSTLVVKKLLKITKDIPKDLCALPKD